jgi:hypothetical protein
LSLPLIFGTNVDTIPVSSYLAPPIKPTIKINESKKKRVGLVLARSATYNNDRHRSIPLETLVPFFDTVEYEFFSLRVGSKREDIQRLGLSKKIKDLSANLKGFAATASAIDQLDLVIFVDTALLIWQGQ